VEQTDPLIHFSSKNESESGQIFRSRVFHGLKFYVFQNFISRVLSHFKPI